MSTTESFPPRQAGATELDEISLGYTLGWTFIALGLLFLLLALTA